MTASYQPRFLRSIRKYVAGGLLAVLMIAAAPQSAHASSDEDETHYDARVQGYKPDVELKSGGSGGAWMMLVLMGVVCVSVIFKDAKRSHLD
jgi:hypothetical protein